LPEWTEAQLARVNRGYQGFTRDGTQPTGMALMAAQMKCCWLGEDEPTLRSATLLCSNGHDLNHEHAVDHLGRCRACRAQGAA
jgi:hypothetical protein